MAETSAPGSLVHSGLGTAEGDWHPRNEMAVVYRSPDRPLFHRDKQVQVDSTEHVNLMVHMDI
jgi:hypothetical protein